MKKSIPIIWERESEAFILGIGREREFPLTPVLIMMMAVTLIMMMAMILVIMALILITMMIAMILMVLVLAASDQSQ